jgi:hypothetical protein
VESLAVADVVAVDELLVRKQVSVRVHHPLREPGRPGRLVELRRIVRRRCRRDMIDVLTLPVNLVATKLTGGCAGGVRVSHAKQPSLGDRLRTLTVVRWPRPRRRRSATSHSKTASHHWCCRYNGCADFEDGSAGSPNLDEASSGGHGNNR